MTSRPLMPRHVALVPAAGTGSRMDAQLPKQYLPLAGRPVLWHTLRALTAVLRIDHIWVVLSAGDQWFDRHDWSAFGARLTTLRCGGPSRAATVLAGLRSMQAHVAGSDWVLVHDAARPCLTADLVERLIETVGEDDAGGILALPIADTVKRADGEERIVETVPRAGLWAAQTPQMFRHAMLLEALSNATLDQVTDEASAMEATGVQPRLVVGDVRNMKITLPADLVLAEAILAGRQSRTGRQDG